MCGAVEPESGILGQIWRHPRGWFQSFFSHCNLPHRDHATAEIHSAIHHAEVFTLCLLILICLIRWPARSITDSKTSGRVAISGDVLEQCRILLRLPWWAHFGYDPSTGSTCRLANCFQST